MKVVYILILFITFTNISIAAEKKCTWNIIKSNCKFQKITDNLESKAEKGIKKLKPIKNILKTKEKKK